MSQDIATPEHIARRLEVARDGPIRLRALCDQLTEEDGRRKPGVGKLSIVEHVCHMLEMEKSVFGARLRRVLEEEDPRLEPVNEAHFEKMEVRSGLTLAELVEMFAGEREGNVAIVDATGPEEWARPVRHPDLGDTVYAAVVDRWSRHDADHLTQIEILVRNVRERNLP